MQEIYFRTVEGGKEKIEITYDINQLDDLMKRIAINCGELRKKKTECKYGWIPHEDSFSYQNETYIKDVHSKKSGNKGTEWDHYDEYEVPLYYCDYKEYTCPPLVDFVDRITYGDKKAFEQLFKKDFKDIMTFKTVKEKIQELENQMKKLEKSYQRKRKEKVDHLSSEYEEVNSQSSDIETKIKNLNEMTEKAKQELERIDQEYEKHLEELKEKLSELLSIKEINENQEPVIHYLVELLSMIEYRVVDFITIEELKRVSDFHKKEVTKEVTEKPKQFVL